MPRIQVSDPNNLGTSYVGSTGGDRTIKPADSVRLKEREPRQWDIPMVMYNTGHLMVATAWTGLTLIFIDRLRDREVDPALHWTAFGLSAGLATVGLGLMIPEVVRNFRERLM